MARRFKTMTDDERDREYSQRLERGLPFIQSELPQFRPRDGENFIRIVPPLEDDPLAGAWGVDLITHYIEGHGWLLSPKSLDASEHDPVDDLIRELRKIDPELEDMVKTSRKTVMHVLDFNADERVGVLKLWGAPPTLVDDFVKAAKDKRSGRTHSLEDPDNGLPLSFDKTGTSLQTRYSAVQLERDPFPLPDWVLDDVEYFEDVLVVEEPDDMAKIIDKILDGAQSGGGRSRRGGRGRGRDRDERPERDEDDAPPPRRGRGRGRDEEEDAPRGRGRGRGRDAEEDAPRGRGRGREAEEEPRGRGRDREAEEEPRGRGRGRGRDRDEDDEPRGRGRGRGRDRDEEEDSVDAVRDRVREQLDRDGDGDEDSGRGRFRRDEPDDNGEEEEHDDPPPRTRTSKKKGASGGRGSKKKAASSRGSSRREGRK